MREQILGFMSSRPYYRCALLIAQDIILLEHQAEELARSCDWPTLRIGDALPALLAPLPPRGRSRAALLEMRRMLQEAGLGPLLCLGVDLLFDPSIKLDPLSLFRDASRARDLVVAWPGQCDGGVLSYAVPEHAHHRVWPAPNAGVYMLEKH